jgi:hypothetical protein
MEAAYLYEGRRVIAQRWSGDPADYEKMANFLGDVFDPEEGGTLVPGFKCGFYGVGEVWIQGPDDKGGWERIHPGQWVAADDDGNGAFFLVPNPAAIAELGNPSQGAHVHREQEN